MLALLLQDKPLIHVLKLLEVIHWFSCFQKPEVEQIIKSEKASRTRQELDSQRVLHDVINRRMKEDLGPWNLLHTLVKSEWKNQDFVGIVLIRITQHQTWINLPRIVVVYPDHISQTSSYESLLPSDSVNTPSSNSLREKDFKQTA